jgi:hypothetical protein
VSELIINTILGGSYIRADFFLRSWIFIRTNLILSETPLPEVDDSEHMSLPGHCYIKQAALFYTSVDGVQGKTSYVVSKEIWKRLSIRQRVILIFHEIIYTEAKLLGAESSFSVRKANAAVLLGKASSYDDLLIEGLNNDLEVFEIFRKRLLASFSKDIAEFFLNSKHSFCRDKGYFKVLNTINKRFENNTINNLVRKRIEKCSIPKMF